MGTNNPQETKTTLVLGGTGKTGRRVVERLSARGLLPVRVGSRSGKTPLDWEDAATWGPVLRNVESVYVSYYPDLAVLWAAATVRSFTDLAVEAGSGSWYCCLAGARKRRRSASRRCDTPVPTGRSCARVGSARTSARI